jgi:pilus assembly protein FimV
MKTAVTPAVKAAEAKTATRESIDLDLSDLDAELEAFDSLPDTASTAVYDAVANDAPTPKTALDEEFDFLADADEAATKLDLARAYIDMGDKEGAKDILQEVIEEGQDAQKSEARKLLAGIS